MFGLILNCKLCTVAFLICKSCYRGQRYCGISCYEPARTLQLRFAGKKYRSTRSGRRSGAKRQAKHRSKVKIVTHQSSLETPDVVETNSGSFAGVPKPQRETSHCTGCNRRIVFFHFSPELMRSVHVKRRRKDKNSGNVSQGPP